MTSKTTDPVRGSSRCVSDDHLLTRRTLVAGLGVAVPAAALAGTDRAAPNGLGDASTDPIFAAIEAHRAADEAFVDACEELDYAEAEAAYQDGRYRPSPLIAWRKYSHIGWSEIDRARREFLGEFPAWPAVAPAEVIEAEYREKKEEFADRLRAGEDWDEQHGITPLRQAVADAVAAREDAERCLCELRPTTEAGLRALATYGCELTDGYGADATDTPAYRILAGLAGIEPSSADDEDEADA